MKRSALFDLHTRQGAQFAEHHGWAVPSSFPASGDQVGGVRERVGLADVSYRSKFETHLQPPGDSWFLAAGHYLILGEPPLNAPPAAIDMTSVYADLLLAGPNARAVLGKLSSLNVSPESLPKGRCAQTNVAHAHAIVLREDLGKLPAFHLLITRDYAESVWTSILHAGEEFDLRPFGLAALPSLSD